ncbi:hypothetical protein [Glutamicibacter protophormiae]|uniref:hypothetical protein n=1 Tax=Glutamicibacter protophormiae TaxID=37930 RepID=UPI001EF72385|nr:hypothetical protein [Glutamicibacter protophormiae]
MSLLLGAGMFLLLFYAVFSSRSEDSDGGSGRHVHRDRRGPAQAKAIQRTSVLRRFANVFSSFGPSDWALFAWTLVFLVSAIAQTAMLLA